MSEQFFIVGAQRSGTTYLYRVLDEHPEIEMAQPVRPEPKFFYTDALFEKGLGFYQNHFFTGKAGAWLRGEKSTTYIESEEAAGRIAGCFPEAKVLFLLRDPIERAISNYWFSVNKGYETLPMPEAFLNEAKRWLDYDHERISVSPYAYLRRGRYINYISMYEHYFPTASIKVMLYEQLIGSKTHLQNLHAFLGVSDYTPAILSDVVNQGNRPDTSLSSELEHYLVDYFAEANRCLAERLGIPLTEWQR
ncbi:sulfotransferase [Chloroflexota bacterium]